MHQPVPRAIEIEAELDEVLTRPRPILVEFITSLTSPLVVLGAGGKMGPTLAVLAQRAARAAGHPLEVIAVSRFSDAQTQQWLAERGVHTAPCDLMDPGALRQLPESRNVIYMVGVKFGTTENPSRTWATNTLIPARVAERYSVARVAILSSGNVYPLADAEGPGSTETDPLTPLGEYANSCVARERVFEHYARTQGTPMAFIRLSYALDLRYGLLADIGAKVYAGQPVDVTMGYANAIWQGDANEMIVRSLGAAGVPPVPLNVTGPRFSLRQVALRFGELLGRPVYLEGTEASSVFLSDISRARQVLGEPPTELETVICWTAHWIAHGGRSLGKPTHFEVRDGAY